MTETPRKKYPTIGNPPMASTRPAIPPPTRAPSWLLKLDIAVAVARDLPANSNSRVGVEAFETLKSATDPKANATVAHGDRWVVNIRLARSPPHRGKAVK
jgi:hypothetical protein